MHKALRNCCPGQENAGEVMGRKFPYLTAR